MASTLQLHAQPLGNMDDHSEQQWKESLIKTFATLHEGMLGDASIDTYLSGTTAAIVLIFPHQLVCASVGDSMAFLFGNSGQVLPLTVYVVCFFFA
jgi:serine/threonine protein phosphatase PrpC